ncbi:MAG: O-antigen/teichoic acid export membrane protein [Sphingobacteriales bacterium]
MKKQYLVNLLFILFINLLIKPFWLLGIDRTVQNIVGPVDYGLYFSLLNFTFIFSIVLDFGITNYNNKSIAEDPTRLQKWLPSLGITKALLSLLFFILVISTGFLIGYSFDQVELLIPIAINQLILSFLLYLRSNVSGLQLFKTDAFLSVLEKLILIIILTPILWGTVLAEPITIKQFVYFQMMALSFTTFVALAILLYKHNNFKWNWTFSLFLDTLKQTYPYALLTLLMAIHGKLDSVMVERLHIEGAYEAGVYASTARILEACTMFAFLFSTILLPLFSSMLAKKQSVENLVFLNFKLLVVPATILTVALMFFSKQSMYLLYTAATPYWGGVFIWIIAGFIFSAFSYIIGTLLTANGSLRHLNFIALGAIVVNISLNLILIPQYGAKGAAIATFFTLFFTTAIQFIICINLFQLSIKLNWYLRVLGFVLGLLAINYFIRFYFGTWPIDFFVSIAISILLAIALKLFPIKDFKFLLLTIQDKKESTK